MTVTPGSTALLLVDLQRDYLARPGLTPPAPALLSAVHRLLTAFRAAGAPVAHVHTVVQPDGSDAMPHWRAAGTLSCIAGTSGAEPADQAAPAPGEALVVKQHYSGFADPELNAYLTARGVTRVVVAGVYEHACVRETVLDAYERGFEVVVASDAVGSDDPWHADATRRWLAGRAASYATVDEVTGALSGVRPAAAGHARDEAVEAAVSTARLALSQWNRVPAPDRADLLDRWADELVRRRVELAHAIVAEVGKPARQAQEEVDRAIGHVRTSARLGRERVAHPSRQPDGISVRRGPHGVVALLTPWNNPIALPCAKIAAATAEGNTVVLAPSEAAGACASMVHRTWVDAGLPAEVVTVASGGAAVGRALVAQGGIDAVALTGSTRVGRDVARACARRGVPLQAELGGNNAAVLLEDADLAKDIPALVRGAFLFAGQRCTAVRRLIVPRSLLDRALPLVQDAVHSIVVGDPAEEATDMGPLISGPARDRVVRAVREAEGRGAVVIAQGVLPCDGAGPGETAGAWMPPVAVLVENPDDPLVQEETFGPVLVLQPADDLSHAIALANGVEQGLLMAVCGSSAESVDRVLREAQVGIVSVGSAPPAIHPDAPFGGWKASGIGPPEHGEWDAWFFSRVQAGYGVPRP